ncbi:putative ABC transport system permease protein [Fodinibius roseus]|uniref:Putative ABC transport system permease protein n=1 Tax=Fodinibius roseus TaxID=1194090 RepID=A0A1M5HWU6_9BACT|nr:ABC transporter permease [Fodinibius roseus]SHG20397.1 putative ABC transport system permease protein [Fodinibius roseus]
MWNNLIREFFADLGNQKLRSFLTLIAIAWGTLSVILLLAFGRGLGTSMMEGMLGAGNQVIVIYGGQTSMNYEGLGIGRRISFTEEDVALLQRSVPGIAHSSPQYGRWGAQLQTGDATTNTYMEGVNPDFEIMRTMYPAAGGRFINEQDVDSKRRVLFLGDEIAGRLFGEENPVGKQVKLDNMPFTVIGVMKPKMQTAMNNGPDADRAVIPYSTFRNIYGDRTVNSILIRPSDPSLQERIKHDITAILSAKYAFHPEDEQAIPIWDFIEMEAMNRKVAAGLEVFLFTVGLFTLIIAGVGVANIMFVVVKERTREIGIKLAVGARKIHIIVQFVFESLLISFMGGFIGLAISSAIVYGVLALDMTEGPGAFLGKPEISELSVIVTIGMLALIGLTAGVFPAMKAARVDPVESLRYE